ncbi:hypothetical protein MIR68_001197 [Amoeboaphelidium protococcarum]|nr:hypothetical protein MIR68_001197 [Amoeboaphelidium protococcarum]
MDDSERLKDDSDKMKSLRNGQQSQEEGESRSHLRWIVLILNCTLLLGNYYAYDNPSALSPQLRQYLKPLTGQNGNRSPSYETIFSLTYSVYSFPNLILPSITGLLIQITKAPAAILLTLSSLTVLGHLLYLFGVWKLSIPLMLVGRFVFGVGGESIGVMQSFVNALWFADKELGMAMGFSLAVPRIGSVLNATLSPLICSYFNQITGNRQEGVLYALGAGVVMCLVSSMAGLILIFAIGIYPQSKKTNSVQSAPVLKSQEDVLDEETQLLNGYQSIVDMDEESDGEVMPEDASLVRQKKYSVFQIIYQFPVEFWLMCLIVFCIYGTIVPFNNVIIDLMLTKFVPLSYENRLSVAGSFMAIADTICAVLVPVSGYIIDRYGRRGSVMFLCCFLMGTVHLIMGFTDPTDSEGKISQFTVIPILPLVVLGLSYSFFGVAYWSSIACLFSGPSEVAQQQLHISDDQFLNGKYQQYHSHADVNEESSPLVSQNAFTIAASSSTASPLTRQVHINHLKRYNTMGYQSKSQQLPRSPTLQQVLVDQRVSTTSLPLLAASRAFSVDQKRIGKYTESQSGRIDGLGIIYDNQKDSPANRSEGYVNEQSDEQSDDFYNTEHPMFKSANTPFLSQNRRRRVRSDLVVDRQVETVDEPESESSEKLAIAYGVATSAMNLSLAIVPIIAAVIQLNSRPIASPQIVDKGTITTPEEFVYVESFFASEAFLASLFSIVIVWLDYRRHKGQLLEASHYIG